MVILNKEDRRIGRRLVRIHYRVNRLQWENRSKEIFPQSWRKTRDEWKMKWKWCMKVVKELTHLRFCRNERRKSDQKWLNELLERTIFGPLILLSVSFWAVITMQKDKWVLKSESGKCWQRGKIVNECLDRDPAENGVFDEQVKNTQGGELFWSCEKMCVWCMMWISGSDHHPTLRPQLTNVSATKGRAHQICLSSHLLLLLL